MLVSPLFRLWPLPRGFVLVTVTGRRSGKPRHRPIRAVRRGGTFYALALLGERSDWLRNADKNPKVRIKAGRRTQGAVARRVSSSAEREAAIQLYVREVFPYDYVDYVSVHWGWPTHRKIQEAHRRWVDEGIMVAIDVERPEEAS